MGYSEMIVLQTLILLLTAPSGIFSSSSPPGCVSDVGEAVRSVGENAGRCDIVVTDASIFVEQCTSSGNLLRDLRAFLSLYGAIIKPCPAPLPHSNSACIDVEDCIKLTPEGIIDCGDDNSLVSEALTCLWRSSTKGCGIATRLLPLWKERTDQICREQLVNANRYRPNPRPYLRRGAARYQNVRPNYSRHPRNRFHGVTQRRYRACRGYYCRW